MACYIKDSQNSLSLPILSLSSNMSSVSSPPQISSHVGRIPLEPSSHREHRAACFATCLSICPSGRHSLLVAQCISERDADARGPPGQSMGGRWESSSTVSLWGHLACSDRHTLSGPYLLGMGRCAHPRTPMQRGSSILAPESCPVPRPSQLPAVLVFLSRPLPGLAVPEAHGVWHGLRPLSGLCAKGE